MKHLKRHNAPKSWPIARKGTKYVVKPKQSIKKGLPILIILRNNLKIAQNRKEVKKALYLEQITLNNKVIRDEKNSALLFDVIKIVPSKKSYRLVLSEKGRFKLEEINKNTDQKIAKVVSKKILKGKKRQLNLSDGNNFISDLKCETNDSVIIDFKNKKKIIKCLPLKKEMNALVFSGKHSGKQGIIEKIKKERKMVELKIKDKKINVLINQLMVLE